MAKPFILIGLTGPARSGKDTAGQHIALRYGFDRYAFAKPLKDGLRAMFQLTDDHLDGALKERPLPDLGRSPRELMQTIGTEWGRHMVHPDLWLLLAERRILNVREETARLGYGFTGLVITDVRFENEAALIRRHGGSVIHLVRPDAPDVRAHSSENGVSFKERDVRIMNDCSLPEFRHRLEFAMTQIIDAAQVRAKEEAFKCA